MTNVTKVAQISKKFVKDYYTEKATAEDREWIKTRIKDYRTERGDRYYFNPFRLEFAKRFLPELFAKRDFLDELEDIDRLDNVA